MGATWADALDDYGRALLDFEHRFELLGAGAGHFAYELPLDLGPLPADLEDVAIALVTRSHAVEKQVQSAMAVLAAQRASVRQARSHMVKERPIAHFIDVLG